MDSHTNFRIMVFSKPFTQLFKLFREDKKGGLPILVPAVCVGKTNSGIDSHFVDIESTAVFAKDIKSNNNNLLRFTVVS